SKTFNASASADYHVATDNGSTHDHTTASTYSDTGSAALGTSYSSVGNNTSTKSQSGNGSLQANASWSHTGNHRNGSAGIDLTGSESTSHTTTNSHNNSDTTNVGAAWSVNNNKNTSNSSTTANTAHADGTASAALSTSVNGTSEKSKNSSSTYASMYSSSSSSSDSHSHSSSRSSSSSKSWGYNVSDSLNTVDEHTTGSVTQHINTQQAGTLDANTGNGAATGVTGNLGVNIAEGINNAQSNDVALASVDMGNVFGNAQIFNTQASSGSAHVKNFNLNASVGDGSLANVSGNVGVNVASGIGNAQNNSLAGSVTTATPGAYSTVAMVATDNSSQNANMSAVGQFQGTASLGANTLTGAQGNIGVNIAGGIGNLQHNGMAIAAMNNGH
ncbi:cell wall anchor protein, partial [Paraburkholderia sp. BR14262]